MALLYTNTQQGPVEGLPAGNPCYTVFKGVPFAAPPVGGNRWRAPQPAEKREGTLKAYKFGAQAWQKLLNVEGQFTRPGLKSSLDEMDEDCLTLNIWTPANEPGERLPVMFWIHGGAFIMGSGADFLYDGEAFCERGVIFVSINYRLGVFGFFPHPELNTDDPYTASGNFGLLDQAAALKWVRDNIESFGGDPENITVFGQSAGAISTEYLVTMDCSKPYIAKAILHSGVGIGSVPPLMVFAGGKSAAEQRGQEFMEKAGADTLDKLRGMDAETIYKLWAGENNQNSSPVVDGFVVKEGSFAAVMHGSHADIPYMFGSNSDEGRLPPQADKDMVRRMLEAQSAQAFGGKADEFLLLCGNETPYLGPLGTFLPTERAFAERQLELGRSAPYIYYFTRKIPEYENIEYNPGWRGAHHSAELMYVFNVLGRVYRPFSGLDYELGIRMADCWANFAKTGNPNDGGAEEWCPYRDGDEAFYEFGINCGMTKLEETPVDKYIKDFTKSEI